MSAYEVGQEVVVVSLSRGRGSTKYEKAVHPYKAAATSLLVGVDPEGALVCEGLDAGQPERFMRSEIVCQSCGHHWVTSREWVRP